MNRITSVLDANLSRDRARLTIAFAVVYVVFLLDWPLTFLYDAHPTIYWIWDLAKFVVTPSLALLWLRTTTGAVTQASLGLSLHDGVNARLRLLFLVLGCGVMLPLIWRVPKPFPWSFLWDAVNPAFDISATIPNEGIAHYLGLLYLAATPAFVEELFFRGLLWRILGSSDRYSALRYILISAFLFGSVHWEYGSTAVQNAMVYGIFAAWLYCRFGSLWPLIVGHFIADWMAFSR